MWGRPSSATGTCASRSTRSASAGWSRPHAAAELARSARRLSRPARAGAALLCLGALAASPAASPPGSAGAAARGAPELTAEGAGPGRHELGELLVVGIPGTELATEPEAERLVCQIGVGAVVLFARNVTSPDQLARFTRDLKARALACRGRALRVAVDAEGGRIMRLSPRAGFPETSSAAELGARDDPAETARAAGLIAKLLARAGIDWNLAPVVDLALDPAGPAIAARDRSFGADPARVTAHAAAFARAMRAQGILTTLKHFPGHGSARADSHATLPDVTATARPELELAPYRALLAAGLADAVMTAHVLDRALDPALPATLSPAIVTRLLRGALGWHGPVVSDDLRMAAIERGWGIERAAVAALAAGVDLLLIADDRLRGGGSAVDAALGALAAALADGSLDRARVGEALGRARAFGRRSAPE